MHYRWVLPLRQGLSRFGSWERTFEHALPRSTSNTARNVSLMIQRLAPVVLLFAATACGPAPVPAPAPALEVAHPEGIEFRLVMDADDPGTTEFAHDNSTLHLGVPQLFEVARVYRSFDEYGFPAIGFEIDKADAGRFEDWTGSIIGSKLAVVVNGQVLTAPAVSVPLSSGGIITGGSTGFTEDEVRDLIGAMDPERR